MASIRVRLTTSYAAALIASFGLFAWALWTRQHPPLDRRPPRAELEPLVSARSDIAAAIIRQFAAEGDPVVLDSAGVRRLRPAIATALQAVSGLVMVFDSTSTLVYRSDSVNALARAEATDEGALGGGREGIGAPYDRVTSGARELTPARRLARLFLSGEPVYLSARFLNGTAGSLERVVAGTGVGGFERALTESADEDLLVILLVTAPLVLAGSVAWAWVLSGRAVRPIEGLIDELEAITDGRSLHRRLKVHQSGDELARLTTTLNAMLGRLENYFGALRRFTADASHELKTPLTVLRADVERAMTTPSASAEQLVHLEEALAETTRMADLVEQLLTLARADEGRFDLHREPVALEPLVRDVYETALILGESAELEVSLTACEPATVLGDRTRLRQLLLNLVTNAIKYTPRGGEVEVLQRVQDGQVTIAVRDTGIGIAAADLPHIFERFWRADRVRSRAAERGGFGLGLAISQWIAQAHGGSLSATSRLTRGSTFTVTLPLAELPPVAARHPAVALLPEPADVG